MFLKRRSTRPVTALSLSLALLLTACGKPLKKHECLELLDRYTDKVVQQARPSASSAERTELQLQARQKAALDPEFAKCQERVSRSQFECALEAQTADEIERCLL